MNNKIHIDGDRVLVLSASDFDEYLDMDDMTSINYSNLFGDAVTCSALLNKVGQLRADAEANFSSMKMKWDICIAEERRRYRRLAAKGGGFLSIDGERIKFTERALEDLLTLNEDVQFYQKEYIDAKKEFEYLNALYFSIQSKDKKLGNILPKGIAPKEFWDEVMEGKVNGFVIRKVER